MSVSPKETLTAAFETFNRTTQRLKAAYDKLQERIAQLDRELEEKNRQLVLKVEELNRTKDYLNGILEAMTDGVVAVDIDGTITTFNRAAQRITGYSAEEVKDRAYGKVFDDDFGDLPRRAAGPSRAQGHGHVASEIGKKDDSRAPVSESVAFLSDRDGNVAGAVKVFQDLTEVTKLREQVRQKDRLAAVGQMAATVAHEIRNPLGGIEGFAALLARDIPDDDPKKRLVRKILVGTRSLNRVVSELLAFTRPMELKFGELDCENLIRSVLAMVGEEGDGVSVEIETDSGGVPMRICGDGEMLRQAFLNIALNAFQSMPDGGELHIAIGVQSEEEQEDRPVKIAFTDTGCGIPQDVLPKIFEPFFTTKEKGTGLGLALAARVIEAHDGRISVSAAEGRGTTFEVHLPAADAGRYSDRGGDDGR